MGEGKPMKGDQYGCLEELKVGTALYDVYAVNKAWTPTSLKSLAKKSDALVKLGEFVLTRQFKQSKFADEKTQFKHVFWAKEVEHNSEARNAGIKTGEEYETYGGCKKY